ncbi:MAG TPA: type II secretion system protein [Tepidisphaeraceae bacterium]|nr:type II secretion system protein [Tepidisphaeraceae bacterium]
MHAFAIQTSFFPHARPSSQGVPFNEEEAGRRRSQALAPIAVASFLHAPRRRGFSLVELLVVLAILTILAGIFVPYFSKIREADRRVRCADNLRAIMDGLRQYASLKDPRGKVSHDYPATPAEPSHNGYTAYTGADASDPFAPGAVKPNDVTASLWLLVRDGFVPANRFICPSTADTPEAMPANPRSNFTDGSHLSYSYASPFSTATGYKMNDDSHVADFAMMADKNPGNSGKNGRVTTPAYTAQPFALARANSNNHGKVGQNVLYADGHVAFQTTPYCGIGHDARRDNIFTALSPIPLSPGQRPPTESNGFYGHDIGPSWTNDSYLVPTSDD